MKRRTRVRTGALASISTVLAVAAFEGKAAAAQYTLCSIEDAAQRSAWESACAYSGGPGNAGAPTVALDMVRNGRDILVVSVPARNCRPAEGRIYGGVSLVVDSSKSVKTTDPNNDRLTAAGELLDTIGADSANHPLAQSDAKYPAVGVVSYGGRSGTEDGYLADGLNKKFSEVFCSNADVKTDKFDSTGARARWQGGNSAGTLYSVCEYLQPIKAYEVNGTDPAGSIDRHKRFLKFTGANPRGATDITYFAEAIQQDAMLGKDTPERPRNAIVITDGLPNIPKYVPEAECKAASYLKDEPIVTQNGRAACMYRQAQFATDKANTYLEQQAARFAGINVYNVLFAPQDKTYLDFDVKGTIYPQDVLIENSARTGNGKVKFKWAKTKEDLTAFLKETLEKRFDKASLQRVIVTVTDASGTTHKPYNAVSPADTAAADGSNTTFTMKFIGLKDGLNKVKVDFVYSDGTFPRTYDVTVTDAGATTTKFACSPGDSTRTVDGDDPKSLDPKGDGVLVPTSPNQTEQKRVYRNADAGNAFDRDALPSSNGSDGAGVPRPTATPDAKKDPRNLRIQGGTGNCGSIASAVAADGGADAPNGASHRGALASLAALALLALPLGFSFIRKEKR